MIERKEYGKEDKTSIVMEREGCGMKERTRVMMEREEECGSLYEIVEVL